MQLWDLNSSHQKLITAKVKGNHIILSPSREHSSHTMVFAPSLLSMSQATHF